MTLRPRAADLAFVIEVCHGSSGLGFEPGSKLARRHENPEQLAEAMADPEHRWRAVTFLTLAVFGRSEVKDPLPGEPGCIPEDLIIVHDASHILGGFNTDQAGEIGIAALQAGYMGKHPAEVSGLRRRLSIPKTIAQGSTLLDRRFFVAWPCRLGLDS